MCRDPSGAAGVLPELQYTSSAGSAQHYSFTYWCVLGLLNAVRLVNYGLQSAAHAGLLLPYDPSFSKCGDEQLLQPGVKVLLLLLCAAVSHW